MKHGLLVQNPLSNAFLRAWSGLGKQAKKVPIPSPPKKILLCNLAHFGDVVISTTVLPVIKKHFPDCEIDFLTSSASAVVLQNHPLVRKVHCFDHGYLHRHRGIARAFLHHFQSKWHFLSKGEDYDVAIDLYLYFPNAIPLLAKSQIPVRIGYTTGGFGKKLTHPLSWNLYDRYLGYSCLNLLRVLGIDPTKESPLPCYRYKQKTKDEIVIHMGSQNAAKEWDPKKWIEIIRKLQGYPIVLTGKGEREAKLCKDVAEKTSVTNRCNQLSWSQFVTTVQEARLLISIDSAAIHVAAATATPTIGIFTGINIAKMWMPPSPVFHGMVNPGVEELLDNIAKNFPISYLQSE